LVIGVTASDQVSSFGAVEPWLTLAFFFITFGYVASDFSSTFSCAASSACFDLYRFLLYDALRRPLPDTPDNELATGHSISQQLFRGSKSEIPYRHPADGAPSGTS